MKYRKPILLGDIGVRFRAIYKARIRDTTHPNNRFAAAVDAETFEAFKAWHIISDPFSGLLHKKGYLNF
jgi:hypothetical protein